MKRDTKGLYQKAIEGKSKNFTGIEDAYEAPGNPDFIFDTSLFEIPDIVKKIKSVL